jgi:hypothetical protein
MTINVEWLLIVLRVLTFLDYHHLLLLLLILLLEHFELEVEVIKIFAKLLHVVSDVLDP